MMVTIHLHFIDDFLRSFLDDSGISALGKPSLRGHLI